MSSQPFTTCVGTTTSEGVEVSPSPAVCCLHGRQRTEHVWSRAFATGRNRSQMGRPENGSSRPKTVAVGCD